MNTHLSPAPALAQTAGPRAITITLDFEDRNLARQVAGALQEVVWPAPDALTFFENGPKAWRVEGYYTDPPDIAELHQTLSAAVETSLPEFTVTEVPNENWVALSQAALPPVYAGRFTIHGSHDNHRIARGPNSILIDAGEAFGTAHHATTYGCLDAIDRLSRQQTFRNCLDLGCGSGVLAIALARTQPHAQILASDLDAQSVHVAKTNMQANTVGQRIKTVVAAGTDHPSLQQRAPFDLLVANILAGPLISLAADIRRITLPGSTLILSGILVPQAADVIASYRAQAFQLCRHVQIEEWSTLILKRR